MRWNFGWGIFRNLIAETWDEPHALRICQQGHAGFFCFKKDNIKSDGGWKQYRVSILYSVFRLFNQLLLTLQKVYV